MTVAALYARVSSQRQAETGTVASQIAALERYAMEHDLTIGHRFIDEGVSGRTLARPGLDRLRDMAVLHEFDVVLCLSPDRLARDLIAQQVVLYELRQLGIEMRFLDQPDFEDGAEATFWRRMRGIFAELERSLIQERMRRGRRYKLQQGQSAPHQAPYGYRYQKGAAQKPSRWEVVPDQAQVVQELFTWYAEGHVTLAAMASALNARQLPGPGGKTWYDSSIRRLLQQPAYKGTAFYGRTRADYSVVGQPRKQGRGRLVAPRYQARPVEEWIRIPVPPLVSETLWEAVQERLQMNARFAQRNSQRNYLFRSLLVCQTCGYTLQGRASRQGRNVTYRCAHGGKRRPPDVPEHRCIVREEELEEALWDALKTLLQEPERLHRAWESLFSPAASHAERNQWEQRRKTLQNRRQRILKAHELGYYTSEELQAALNPVLLELQEVEDRLKKSAGPLETPDFDCFQQAIQWALDAADASVKQDVIRLLIERILVSEDAFVVDLIVPLTDSRRLEGVMRDA